MHFDLTEEQTARQTGARAFAEAKLSEGLVDRDRAGATSAEDWRAHWKAAGEYGVFALCGPKAYGGEELDILTTVIVLEAIGYGCRDNGLTLGLNGQLWAVQEPIEAFGTEAQKAAYLPAMMRGDLVGAHAMTEPASGSDAMAMATVAERDGADYILNGEKTYVGMAPGCDMAIVFASTRPDRGPWGVSAFLVDADTPGFHKLETQEKMGLRTSPMGRLGFENCRVPESARLGREGAGGAIFQHSMEWERRLIFTSHIGAMARQVELCYAFAKSREVFDKPILQHQSVSNRLANMSLRLETSRLLLYKAAWQLDNDIHSRVDAAMVKLHLSEAFVESSLDAIRIHGGAGYLTDTGIERDLRDALGGVIYSGTSDIQRQLIAALSS
ncbi:MAG: acyl-CoA dehydrogenase family protein [Pseudomonadota bacterium]